MGRLIDEDAVKRRMHETMDYQDLYLPVHFEMCMGDAPTIDAVQVVRCKDCRFFKPWDNGYYGKCKAGYAVMADMFCSCGSRADGERKDDGK